MLRKNSTVNFRIPFPTWLPILALTTCLARVSAATSAPSAFVATQPMNTGRSVHSETVLPNGKVFVTGGSFGVAAELFDPATNHFTVLPAGAVTDRVYGSATAMKDRRILLVGGTD
jgi:hypothetical protein